VTTTAAGDRSFLAHPDEVLDWRHVVLVDAAAETGLLDALPGTPVDVASRTDLAPEAVRGVLEALSVFDIVAERDGVYALAPVTPEELAAIRHHARAVRRWSAGLPGMLRGQQDANGRHPQNLDVFLPALAGRARERADGLVARCLEQFDGATRVLDLGGGHGEYSLAFARAGCNVTLQDLPAVVEWLTARGDVPEAGVHLVAGDLTQSLAEGPFDLVLLAGITHIFSGPQLVRLFTRLRDQVTATGGLAISTNFRGQGPTSPLFAVQMMLNGRGGDTHAQDDYKDWLRAAGFSRTDEVPLGDDRREWSTLLFAMPS
jgi:SAM-dependent methyltransferase